MNQTEIRQLFDEHLRQGKPAPDFQRDITPYVTRTYHLDMRIAFIGYSDLADADDVDAVIQQQIDYFEQLGCDFEWKYYDYDAPDDLPQRLLAKGFRADDEEALMILDIEQASPELYAPPAHDVRVATAEQLRDADAVSEAVWGRAGDVSARVLPAWEYEPQSVSVHIAYVDDVPVAFGIVNFHEGSPFASLWAGATLPDYRKRGIYTALVASRMQAARQRGFRYLLIDADQNTSMPIVQKHGFQWLAYTTPFNWQVRNET